jgi:hypothetical protein
MFALSKSKVLACILVNEIFDSKFSKFSLLQDGSPAEGDRSVVQCLLSICDILGSISSTAKIKRKPNKKKIEPLQKLNRWHWQAIFDKG